MARSTLLAVATVLVGITGCQSLPVLPDELSGQSTGAQTPQRPAPVLGEKLPEGLPSRSSVHAHAAELLDAYLANTDAITSRGGVNPDEIADVVTPEWIAQEYRGFSEFERQQMRTLGRTTHDHLLVQSVRRLPSGQLEIAVFSCVDSRSVWVIPLDAPDPPDELHQWLNDGSPALVDSDETPAPWQDYIDNVSPRPGGVDPVLLWLQGPDERSMRLDFADTWRGHHPCDER